MRNRRVFYYLCVILSLVLISFRGGAFSYGLFYFFALIPVISYIYLFAVHFCFRIYQKLESRDMISNSPKDYYFILKNESFMSFASVSIRLFSTFSTIEELPDDSEFSLVRGEQYRYDTRLICKYRGEYEVGIKEIIITDFLRLFKLRYKMPGTIKALVAPRLIDMPSIRGLSDIVAPVALESLHRNEDMDIVVRDYVAGDPLRQINWKMTAKEGSLKIRLMNGEEKRGIALVVDTFRYSDDIREYLPLEDQIIKMLLAVSLYFVNKGIPLKVIYQQNGIKCHELRDMSSFNEFYELAASLVFDKRSEIDSLLLQRQVQESEIIIAIYHEMKSTSRMELDRLADRGSHVISYVVNDENSTLEKSSIRNKIIQVPVNCNIEEELL